MTRITVVLASDSFLIGDGLASMLADVDDIEVVGRVRTHEELSAMVDALSPDIVVLSIRNPVYATMPTIVAARKLHADNPELGIVVISDRGNGFALELLRDGASRIAYLLDDRLPSIDSVLGAMREVHAGQTVLDPTIVDNLIGRSLGLGGEALTPRESDVLEQLAEGLSNSAIAAEVNLSTKAVEKYITTIFRKLDLTDPSLVDRRVTAALSYLRSQSNPVLGLVQSLEAQRLQHALALGRATLAAVVESTSAGLVICDADGGNLTMDETALRLHELVSETGETASTSLEDLRDRWELSYPDGRPMPYDEWPLVRATRGDFVREFELRFRSRRTGRQWDCSVNIVPVHDAEGRITRVVQTLRDITVPKAAERELLRQRHILEQQALADDLTGVANRRHFLALAGYELKRAQRAGQPLTIVMLDLDRFKRLNELHGNETGDRALIWFARRTESVLRENDVFARVGGNEFVLMLPHTDLAQGHELVSRIRESLASSPFDGGTPSAPITVSVGLATMAGETDTIEQLLASADSALFAEKRRRPE